MKEIKDKCKLCKKSLGSGSKYRKKFKDNVRVKCGDWLDECFHLKCWLKMKIY